MLRRQAGKELRTFRRIVVLSSSCQALQILDLNIKAELFPETSVAIYKSTRCSIPYVLNLQLFTVKIQIKVCVWARNVFITAFLVYWPI